VSGRTLALGTLSRHLKVPLRAPAAVPVVAGVVLVSHKHGSEAAISNEDRDGTGGVVLGNVLHKRVVNSLPQWVVGAVVGLGIRGSQAHVIEGEYLLRAGVDVVGGVDLAVGGDNHLVMHGRIKKKE